MISPAFFLKSKEALWESRFAYHDVRDDDDGGREVGGVLVLERGEGLVAAEERPRGRGQWSGTYEGGPMCGATFGGDDDRVDAAVVVVELVGHT